jgi:mannose-6-phosphate isomerase-like protein (cupin superfamily)
MASRDIYNPDTDQKITFLKTGPETGGELLEVEIDAGPDSKPPVDHFHRVQEESFEILEGQVQFRIAGEQRTVGPGEPVVIPPGVAHVWWNSASGRLRMRCRFRPAGEMEDFWRVVFGLAREGRTRGGVPHPPPLMGLVLNRYGDSTWPARQRSVPLTRLPFALQRAVMFGLATAGRAMGYKAALPPDN